MLVVLPDLALLRERRGVCSAKDRLTRRRLLLLAAKDIREGCRPYAHTPADFDVFFWRETDDEGDDPPAPVPIVSLGSSSSLSIEARVFSPSERGQLGTAIASGPISVPAPLVLPFSSAAGR